MTMSALEHGVSGALLKSARLRLGLSQTAFADLVGVAQPTLSAYESGRRQPTIPTLLRILARAGLELRMELTERDDHDDVLAGWERSLTDVERQRLRARGYHLTSDVA
ncbi:MAG: helix-turn-helix domain-containing protein [Acidimicrobiia bacterium]|nr:helix-turn-helix domain-containing protein [Acidimicrobiia bacterium]